MTLAAACTGVLGEAPEREEQAPAAQDDPGFQEPGGKNPSPEDPEDNEDNQECSGAGCSPNGPPVSLEVACEHTGSGTDYAVGPDQMLSSLGEVPWSELGPGDSVRVFWREEPYRERFLLSRSGTAEQPIRVCGVAGPEGALPVLDGENSVPAPTALWPNPELHGSAGIIHLYYDATQNFNTDYPSHLVIEGFEIRRAFQEYPATPAWGEGAAGIVIWRGKNITIRGNYIHDNSNGIFVNSTGPGHSLIEGLLVEGNRFVNNGELPEASFRSHHSYIQGAHTVYQFNRYEEVRPNSAAAALKDRGPGTVVRYNWITGGVLPIDLVEAQEHFDVVKDDPLYDTAWVYGNYLRGSGVWRLIHFGGESSNESHRKGPLYVYHNTLHFDDGDDVWRTAVVGLDHPDGVAYLHNNLIFREGGREDGVGITIIDINGTAHLGANWISGTWREGNENSFVGAVLGAENIVTGVEPYLDPSDMRPTLDSPAYGAAGDLPDGLEKPDQEYGADGPRVRETASDLGAFEVQP